MVLKLLNEKQICRFSYIHILYPLTFPKNGFKDIILYIYIYVYIYIYYIYILYISIYYIYIYITVSLQLYSVICVSSMLRVQYYTITVILTFIHLDFYFFYSFR